MTVSTSMFKSPEGQARYFAAYEATLALWPVPLDSFDISTRFGSTHVHVCGPQTGQPLLLLPGQAVSSTMWYPNIAVLSRNHRVYALDIIGDMGKSVRTQPMQPPADFDRWLRDVFAGLDLEQTHVAGLSYGGFLAIRAALSVPERVNKLVLLSPASLLRIRLRFFLRLAALFLPNFVLSLAAKQRVFLGIHSAIATPVIKQMMTRTDFRYQMVLPPVCKDEELQQIQAPTLLLLGDHEIIYDYKAAIKRAEKLIPDIETAVIPNAGHALSFDQPELVNQRILTFLESS